MTEIEDRASADVRGEPADIDAAWMTAALDAAGVARGATVTELRMEGFIGTGQTGRNARFALTWDDPTDRPASVVGKFPSGDPSARAFAFENGTYLNEWTFYSQVAGTLEIRTPVVHVARYDPVTPDFVLIMEDLADSRQGDQFDGLSEDHARLAVAQAVGLHAPRWGNPGLSTLTPDRPSGEEAAVRLGTIYEMMVEPFLDRLGSGLDPDIVDLVRELGPHAVAWSRGTDTPHTVVHLDFRSDNFMFGTHEEAPPLVVVDWQTVTEGNAMWDLAYLIGGSFLPPERARVERGLLEHYRQGMAAAGVEYDAETMWRDYRHGALWGVVMTVIATILAAQTERGDAMLTVMAQRHGRHALDLQSLDLVR